MVGFGAVAISGAYGAIGRKPSPAGAAGEGADAGQGAGAAEETNRYFSSPNRGEYLLVAAPVFGIVAMAVRPGGAEFGHVWAVVGYVIWVIASVLLLRVVRPAEARIRTAASADDPAATSAATRLMWASGACDLLFVVALFVMVIQPG